jgi:uncharacterized protein (TIGR03118 family)
MSGELQPGFLMEGMMMRLLGSAAALAFVFSTPVWAEPVQLTDTQLDDVAAAGIRFTITNQVSDQTGVAPVTDAKLVNPWGLSQAPGGPLWVANQGSNTSTLYGATNFAKVPLTVEVPGGPTGTTFVRVPGAFNITNATGTSGITVFAFASLNGQITGWNPGVDLTHAFVAVDESASGSSFTGLTLGTVGNASRLYAADFAHGVVSVYDSSFAKVGSFTDPKLPSGFSPFNVQTLNGELFVTFAPTGPGAGDDDDDDNLGFVAVFDTSGNLLRRLKGDEKLNKPWGLAIAPPKFGKFAGALLVGNLGDGKINAFDPVTGKHLGTLKGDDGRIKIDGLWGLRTGPNGTITFSAGPVNETHGLIGSIDVAGPRFDSDEMISLAEMRGN